MVFMRHSAISLSQFWTGMTTKMFFRLVRKRFFLWYAICILAVLSFSCSKADALERITSFDSHIIVHKDASMTITENITVKAEGNEIKRGIYRDFPTKYTGKTGFIKRVGFHVLEVLRDGRREPFHLKPLQNGTRVYIGSENVFLPEGKYTYTLVYRTDRQIGFFEAYDELYWNVTGNGWIFMIEKVSASVTLPGEAGKNIIATDAYTGMQGEKNKHFREEINHSSGTVYFFSTRTFAPSEGLTIAVAWPKGYVSEPVRQEKALLFYKDNRGILWGVAGLFAILLYYLTVWSMVGKDPAPGIIVTRYAPPVAMTPPVMRYIRRMGYDAKCLASALINMAAKGMISIKEKDGEYSCRKKVDKDPGLSPDETILFSKLFSKNKSEIVFVQKNHQKIRDAVNDLRGHLRLKFEKIYFITNKWYFIAGLSISAGVLFLSGYTQSSDNENIPAFVFMCIWLTIWTFGITILLYQVMRMWRGVFRKGSKKTSRIGGAVFLTLFSLPFLAAEVFGLYLFSTTIASFSVLIFLGIGVAVNILFYYLLKTPTRAGRTLLDKIEGFRVFLSATEKDRLNFMNPPEKTPELFEKYLPYALALDVEQKWAEQFSDVLAASTRHGEHYSPAWYSGDLHSLDPGSFASTLGSALSESVSSSSSASGSSSGSGGGGSSGGGGGGGGGGGW